MTPMRDDATLELLCRRADIIFVGELVAIDQRSVGIWHGLAAAMDKATYQVIQCLKCDSPMKPGPKFDVFYNGKPLGENALAADIETMGLPKPGDRLLVFAEFVPTNGTNRYWGIGFHTCRPEDLATASALLQSYTQDSAWYHLVDENLYQNLDSLAKFARQILEQDPFNAERLCKTVLSVLLPGNSAWRAPFYDVLSAVYRLTDRSDDANLADKERSRCLNDQGQ